MPPDTHTASITADHVAERAGVSRWTVNRAFKKDASISPHARARVMQAAQELGYMPDLLASSLASDRSNLVALLIDDFANPHKLVMLERLTRILRVHGWSTLLVNTLDPQDAKDALLSASQRRVDAAVLIGSGFNDQTIEAAIGARRLRKLIVFARSSANPNTVSICCDDRAAVTAITDHVVSRGYTRPLFIAGPQTTSAHLLRQETFVQRWSDMKGNEPPVLCANSYDPDKAYALVVENRDLFAASNRPDVLVCENDSIAMGTIDALKYELGLRVPQDIAVTGFDDVPQAASPHYRLTTYRQPLTAMAEGLAGLLTGNPTRSDLSTYTGRLIVRDSA